jgi:hypothetical protein
MTPKSTKAVPPRATLRHFLHNYGAFCKRAGFGLLSQIMGGQLRKQARRASTLPHVFQAWIRRKAKLAGYSVGAVTSN